jgi:hypothetical protein
LLPNTLRSEETFILLFSRLRLPFRPTEDTLSFLTQSYQS